MNDKLETYLTSMVRGDAAVDWRQNPGYGTVEYTVEFDRNRIPDLKAFAKNLSKSFGAFEFSTYKDGSLLALKFVVNL